MAVANVVGIFAVIVNILAGKFGEITWLMLAFFNGLGLLVFVARELGWKIEKTVRGKRPEDEYNH